MKNIRNGLTSMRWSLFTRMYRLIIIASRSLSRPTMGRGVSFRGLYGGVSKAPPPCRHNRLYSIIIMASSLFLFVFSVRFGCRIGTSTQLRGGYFLFVMASGSDTSLVHAADCHRHLALFLRMLRKNVCVCVKYCYNIIRRRRKRRGRSQRKRTKPK